MEIPQIYIQKRQQGCQLKTKEGKIIVPEEIQPVFDK